MVTPRTLAGHRLVGLDTTIFIYAFEANADFGQASWDLLASVRDRQITGVASTIVLGELLVRPYRSDQPDVARFYEDALTEYPNLDLVPADSAICRTAAELRGRYPTLRLPDAIHLATAVAAGATAFVS